MKFNEKIIMLRKNKNLSQEDLGNELGVARQTISKWELGETTPEMDKLIKMSEIFEITLDDLIKDTEPNISNKNFKGYRHIYYNCFCYNSYNDDYGFSFL